MFELQKISPKNINAAIKFLLQHEAFCVDLMSEILALKKNFIEMRKSGAKSFLLLSGQKVIAVFYLQADKTFLFCFPKIDDNALKFFFTRTKKFFATYRINNIMGTKLFSRQLELFLTTCFHYKLIKRNEYFLLHTEAPPQNTAVKTDDALFFYRCTNDDIEKLLPLELAYEKEELEIENGNPYFSKQYLIHMINEHFVFKCEYQNNIIARMHTNAIGMHCKQFGGVYTVKEFRRCGIAKKLFRYAMHYLSTSTKSFVLFVKTKNIPAINLYEALGFTKIDEFEIIQLSK